MPIPKQLTPYLKYFPTLALLFGLVFDIFTLNRPDAIFENAVITLYLLLSAAVMLLLQARKEGSSESRRLLLLGVLQFSFGNLASALMILYSHSGTLAGSAIFIGILALLFLGNEVFRNRYARTHLRVAIWFVLLLTYSTILLPVLLNSIDTFVFIVSVLVALGMTSFLVFLLAHVAHSSFYKQRQRITLSVLLITVLFSGMYFTHLIPPVPLALKHIGIYHEVTRSSDTYTVRYEAPQWFEFWRDTDDTFSHAPGTPVYCFTSVFAPSRLKTEIRHRWEKYNPETEKWSTIARIPFPIFGGRLEGFRGYTQTSQITEGKWRCSVETSRGALIGRETFVVPSSPTSPKLKQRDF